jgi:hypothetical protein
MSASFVSVPVRTTFFQQDQLASFNREFKVYAPPAVRTSAFEHVPRPLNVDAAVAFYHSRGGLLPPPPGKIIDFWA